MRKKIAILAAVVFALLVLASVPQNACAPTYIAPGRVNIHPETLNLKSNGKWVTCEIELPFIDAYTVTQGGVTHTVSPVERAENDAVYYDYWSASAHTEFVEPYVSKLYLYTNTLTGELSFFVHHNIDSNTPPHVGSPSATVRFDFDGLPAGVTTAQSDDNLAEFDVTRPVEGTWGYGYNTDGGVIGDIPTDTGWSFSIDPTFAGSHPMTSWVYVDSDGSEISLDMAQPVTITHLYLDAEVEDIDVSTVAITDINGNPVSISAEVHPVGVGETYLMVKFDRPNVQDACVPGDATITVSGELFDGTIFEGSDTIRVINP
ncbi:MAG: hypothetical protein JSW00_03930 [Thermoplasmata archaeon]|nr:MAG: hypothetical protein JSW00_03930 [Thermoplasmata archaeon]